ncbi:MAG: hypothetical protein GY802_24125 [Gammaproteobacteria bacterium]|nr:hypothetical protein [Gammaproteobacteria bacterium]
MAALAFQRPMQPAKVSEPILIVEKTGRASMATLDDVPRQTVDVDAGSPRHRESMAEIEHGPFS